MNKSKEEWKVRKEAREILGIDVEQTATFKSLGLTFEKNDPRLRLEPDGWLLPKKSDGTFDTNKTAMLLELKDISTKVEKAIDQLMGYIDALLDVGFKDVIGIIYNGKDVIVFHNHEKLNDVSNKLESKDYYLNLFSKQSIDSKRVRQLTADINDKLHFNLLIENLKHRMELTADALVAEHCGANLKGIKGRGYSAFKNAISEAIKKEETIIKDNRDEWTNNLNTVVIGAKDNKGLNSSVDKIIDDICEINDMLNHSDWYDFDIMGVFFDEFNRYKEKTDLGQIFTPEHITSFMYRLINVQPTDKVGDFTCGSGRFLTKALGNMIRASGGSDTIQAQKIKTEQLYGIEYDLTIHSLVTKNMYLHGDGRSKILHLDTRTEDACNFIASSGVNKVLMNPPFERKNGCIDIVANVLNNVEKNADCAFILPDRIFEQPYNKSKTKTILDNHRLLTIIKLPKDTFDAGISTSIFIFKAHEPQNKKQIFTCKIDNDGLIRVKNNGRHDLANKWHDKLEDYWLNVVEKHTKTEEDKDPWIDSDKCHSYQETEQPFEISDEDFLKTMMAFEMFNNGININELSEKLTDNIMYFEEIE